MKNLLAIGIAFTSTWASAIPVTLAWDPPAGPAPAGYLVGFGESSGQYPTIVDVGNTLVCTISDLITGRTYYVSVMAYNAGATSPWATEIMVAPLATPPPPSVSVAPVTGLWSNPAESGSGYTLDFKHGVLVVLVFSYSTTGESQWYIASGPITGATFTSRLDKFRDGQCISCAYPGTPSPDGNDGIITINFSSPTSAVAHLPGGRVTPIQPTPF